MRMEWKNQLKMSDKYQYMLIKDHHVNNKLMTFSCIFCAKQKKNSNKTVTLHQQSRYNKFG